MTRPRSTTAVIAMSVLIAVALGVVLAISMTGNPTAASIPASLATAVGSDIVRTDGAAVELAYSTDATDPIRLLGAEALSEAYSQTRRALPSSSLIATTAKTALASGASRVLLAETLALSARALHLSDTRHWIAVPSEAQLQGDQPTDQIRLRAAQAALSGDTSQTCAQARRLIPANLLGALLLWPMSGCVATNAEAKSVRHGYDQLGENTGATRSLAAAFRITADSRFRVRLQTRANQLSSITYPSYLTADSADSLVLIAISGVPLPRSPGIANYIFQQRMTQGGLIDPGQESGASVGYAATLVRRVLKREPMLADSRLKLSGADSVAVAAEAAYELASQGDRDPSLLMRANPKLAVDLRAYPGISGLFFSHDCAGIAESLGTWRKVVRDVVTTGSIRADPALAVMLAFDARAIRACSTFAPSARDELRRVDVAASETSTYGSTSAASIKAVWAGAQLVCLSGNARAARHEIAASGFQVDNAVRHASSTDDLFYIYRLFEISSRGCQNANAPW